MPDRTIRQQKYQLWLATPSQARPKQLRTRRDVATKFGIGIETLREWEALTGWWDEVFAIARGILGKQLGNILAALGAEARKGSVAAAKLSFQVLGVHHENIQHQIDVHQDQLVLILHGDAANLQLPRALEAPPMLDDNNDTDVLELVPTYTKTTNAPRVEGS